MNVLICCKDDQLLSLGHKLHMERHKVKYFMQNNVNGTAGTGFVERVTRWRPYIKDADLMVLGPGFGMKESVLRELGKPYIGSSMMAETLESEDHKWDLLRRANLGGLLDGLRGENPSDVVLEGWFNGRKWLDTFILHFNEGRFMSGNLGAYVGSMGTVSLPIEPCSLTKRTIEVLDPWLEEIRHKGPVSIGCWCFDDHIDTFGVSLHFQPVLAEALYGGTRANMFELLLETAHGISKNLEVSGNWLGSLRVTKFPWPWTTNNPVGTDVIEGITDVDESHLFYTDIDVAPEGTIYAACDSFDLLRATSFGRTPGEAKSRVYKMVDKLSISDVQYRTDIGDRVNEDFDRLKSWGYLNG